MKKRTIFFGLLLTMSIDINAMELSHDGYLRLGYQSLEDGVMDKHDKAMGGKLNIELKQKGYFALGASLYATYALKNQENIGVPFYDNQNNSYAILGEAYLRLKFGLTKVVIGRQAFDSPFANADDIGMIPNTPLRA